jgi:zinc transport system substrate-binding protein
MNLRIPLLATLSLCACRENKPTHVQDSVSPVVLTVNVPLADFARRIGGDFIEGRFPGPADIDPAYWQPDAETIIAYQNADLILKNGAGYANWLANASLPLSKTIDCSGGLESGFIELEGGTPHTHGPAGEHDHGDLAFTLWLDPIRATRMAANIEQAFSARWPERSDHFSRNLTELQQDLASIDHKFTQAFKSIGDQAVIFSHPVYQYLEERYTIHGRSLHWEPEESPTDEQWAELDDLLSKHPAKLMIWEDQPLEATVAKLARRDITAVVFKTGSNHADCGYIQLMRENLDSLTGY